MRIILSIIAVLLFVPGWSGEPRLPLLTPGAAIVARPYVPAGGWPARIGALRPLGAVTLASDDRAFGSWSAMAIREGRITLLGDGGNIARFALRAGRVVAPETGFLRDGPGTGWRKLDRDSESLTVDPASGTAWVGYERANAIWRYTPGLTRAEASRRPPEMRRWWSNSGAESLVRLRDGRFLAIAERSDGEGRAALLFNRDPTVHAARSIGFRYMPPAGHHPSDAAQLPGGDILVLNRAHRPPLRFSARLVRLPLAALRAGAKVTGREIATLAPPMLDENAEALAVTVEGGATMIWIATDNDGSRWRPSYLYKFRLAEPG